MKSAQAPTGLNRLTWVSRKTSYSSTEPSATFHAAWALPCVEVTSIRFPQTGAAKLMIWSVRAAQLVANIIMVMIARFLAPRFAVGLFLSIAGISLSNAPLAREIWLLAGAFFIPFRKPWRMLAGRLFWPQAQECCPFVVNRQAQAIGKDFLPGQRPRESKYLCESGLARTRVLPELKGSPNIWIYSGHAGT